MALPALFCETIHLRGAFSRCVRWTNRLTLFFCFERGSAPPLRGKMMTFILLSLVMWTAVCSILML